MSRSEFALLIAHYCDYDPNDPAEHDYMTIVIMAKELEDLEWADNHLLRTSVSLRGNCMPSDDKFRIAYVDAISSGMRLYL